jgi:hypothetical protein
MVTTTSYQRKQRQPIIDWSNSQLLMLEENVAALEHTIHQKEPVHRQRRFSSQRKSGGRFKSSRRTSRRPYVERKKPMQNKESSGTRNIGKT